MLFAGLFEAGEGTVPELIEFGPERLEAVGIHLVDAAIGIRPVGDESRVFEHLGCCDTAGRLAEARGPIRRRRTGDEQAG